MWIFLTKLIDYLFKDILDRLDIIIENQHQMKEVLVSTKVALLAVATAVNDYSNKLAASLTTITQQFVDLNAKLVDASSPQEVNEVMAVPLANLQGVTEALVKLAADNNAANVPPVPPVEPLPPVVEPPVTPPVEEEPL